MTSLLTSAAYLLTTGLFYVQQPVVNMREHPSNDSKVVSQTVFSEKIEIEKEQDGWSYILTSDGYSGWVESNAFIALEKSYDCPLKISRLSAHVYGVKDTEFGPIMTLPYGTGLQILDDSDARWIKVALVDGKEAFIQKGDVEIENEITTFVQLIEFSKRFLGLPYTWGGRSSFGYDCSGFVQMLYGKLGMQLQRDSKQQVLDKRFETISIDSLEIGDLLFFGKSEQRIMHVGMYIGNGQFIHASSRENKPWIRISKLTDFEWTGSPEAYYSFRTARHFVSNLMGQAIIISSDHF